MKSLLIPLCLLSVLAVTGCSSKPVYVELNKENIAELNPSKVKEICIVSPSHGKTILYSYNFPITDPEKIKIIIECIQDANHIEDYYRQVLWPLYPGYIRDPNQSEYTLRQNRRNIQFKTSKAYYETLIAWDDKLVCGLWWQSPELSKNFKKWNLFEDISRADPNWPQPDWTKNPPPESDPNFPPNKLPWNRYPELGMKRAIKLTRENFSKLDASKIKEVCIVSRLTKNMYVFPINDPEKIDIIFRRMKDANQIKHDMGRTRSKIYFVIGHELYFTDIDWDNESVYGNWWQSPELSKNFKKWNLFEDISKADPNFPPSDWIKNPPPEGAPYDPNLINLDPNYIPFR